MKMAKRPLEDREDFAVVSEPSNGKEKRQKISHTEFPDAEASAKAERKERKRLKKLQKESSENGKKSPVSTADAGDSDPKAEKAARKARRRAEKERRKALKDGDPGDQTESGAEGKPDTTEIQMVINEGKDRYERNSERAKQKAEAKDDDANGSRVASKAEKKTKKKRVAAEEKNKDSGEVSMKEAAAVNSVVGNRTLHNHVKNTIDPTNTHNGDTQDVLNAVSSYIQDLSLTNTPQAKIDKFLKKNFISVLDPKSTKSLRPIMAFSQLPNDAHPKPSPFAKFKNPTPIQAASWPFLLDGRDVVGVAETGSGKTLAFGVPCIRHILSLPNRNKKSPAKAVMVSPTRELAVQIHEQIETIAKPAGLHSVCVFGGVPKESQRAELKTAHIIVATPGRLNDLVEEGYARLGDVSYLVLDEADRMLDKGFEDAIKKIVAASGPSATRQTLMFTATWPPSVRDLAETFMREPVKIAIGDNPSGELRANARVKQTVEVVEPRDKQERLLKLLKQYQTGIAKNNRILVFCLYKKEATRVEAFLRAKGIRVSGIHGDLSQAQRTASLESFKNGNTPLLVATDVAARGLDIPDVKLVINMTFPLTAEDYVHRIGRTGRAGAEGHAITLFTEQDKAQSGALINVLKGAKQPVPDALLKFGTTVKKKAHEVYGAFYKENTDMKEATKIKFDD